MKAKCVAMVRAFRSHPSLIEYCLQNEINADLSAGLSGLYKDLAVGLGALYLALFGISLSVTRRLVLGMPPRAASSVTTSRVVPGRM